MSNFVVPNTFVPGTKAKAQEVNENFTAVQNELNQKAEKNGNSTQTFSVANATENNHAVNKSQFETALNSSTTELNDLISRLATHFVVEKAYTNSSGEPAFMTSSGGTLLFLADDNTYGPIVAVPANNLPRFSASLIESIDLSSYQDGTYNVYLNNNGTVCVYDNVLYIQKNVPSSPSNNCIFVDVSKSPITAKIYQNSSWVDFNGVPLGSVTVSNGEITTINHNNLNDNGINVSRINQLVVVKTYQYGTGGYKIWSNGLCEQWATTSVANAQSVSFLTSFANTQYTLVAVITDESKYSYYPMLNNKRVNGFNYQVNYGGIANTGSCHYYAIGYVK